MWKWFDNLFKFGEDVPPQVDIEQALSGTAVDTWGLFTNLRPYNPDDLVVKKGRTEAYDIYDRMPEDDAQVKAALMFKQFAILSAGWSIEPASDGQADIEIAECLEWNLRENLSTTFESVILAMLNGLQYGFSVNEIVWENLTEGEWAGTIGIKRINSKPERTFDFETDDFGNLKDDGLIQFMDTGSSEKRLDISKFIIWTYQFSKGNYYGTSDLRAAYRPYFSKDLVDRFWNIAIEKHGVPPIVGKVPSGTRKEKRDTLLEVLKALQSNSAIVINDDEMADFLKIASGDYDVFDGRQRYNDKQIMRAVLMPDLASGEGDRVGSLSLGQVHSSRFLSIVEYTGNEIESTANKQLIQPWTRFNFNTNACPCLRFGSYDPEKREKLAALFADLVDTTIVEPTEEFLREELELPPREDVPVSSETFSHKQGEQKAIFRRKRKLEEKVDTDKIKERFDEFETVAVEMLADVVRGQRKSLVTQFRDGVDAEMLTLPDDSEFQEVLYGVLVNSVLWGMYDASQEISGQGITLNFQVEDTPISPEDAIEFFADKIPIPQELLDIYTRKAFTIANIHSTDILELAKLILQTGLIRGTSSQNQMLSLGKLFDGFLQTGEIKDGSLVEPYRLETIVRTNSIEAYNSGRLNLYRSKDVRDAVPAVIYSAIIDSRTTPFCRAWDGAILQLDDPRLDEVTPPNHFNCRSLLVPVTTAETFELTAELPSERPAKGFEV